MIVVNVRMSVDPSKKDAYLQFVNELVSHSVNDEGNISYEFYKKQDADNEYAIIEHWNSQDALDNHESTAHFKKFNNEVGDYLTADPEILVMQNDQ